MHTRLDNHCCLSSIWNFWRLSYINADRVCAQPKACFSSFGELPVPFDILGLGRNLNWAQIARNTVCCNYGKLSTYKLFKPL